MAKKPPTHLAQYQFKPGNEASKKGAEAAKTHWNMRNEARSFRVYCDSLLKSKEGRQEIEWALRNLMGQGRYKEWLQLLEFLASYAYGTPKVMTETEEDEEGNILKAPAPIIQINQPYMKELAKEDAKYTKSDAG